jgi:hypothetical protein
MAYRSDPCLLRQKKYDMGPMGEESEKIVKNRFSKARRSCGDGRSFWCGREL